MSNALYSDFSDLPVKMGSADVIRLLRELNPRLRNTVAGVAFGLGTEIPFNTQYSNMYMHEKDWDIKYKATVINTVNVLKKVLILNSELVNHIAKSVYVERCTMDPEVLFNYLEAYHGEIFKKSIFNPLLNSTQEISDDEREEYFRIESNIWYDIFQIINKYENSGFDFRDNNSTFHNYLNVEVSKLMEKEEYVGMINIKGLLEVVHTTFTLGINLLTEGGGLHKDNLTIDFIIEKMVKNNLPENFTLTETELVNLRDILRGIGVWKI